MSQRVLFGATLLAPGEGGIARVARMTARVLVEDGHPIDLLTFLDREPVEIAGNKARSAKGNRVRYAALCQLSGLGAGCAIYDSVGTARAHPLLGGGRIPYATWVHGIEVWHALHPSRRRALERSALVLVNSRFTIERFLSLHGPLDVPAKVCWLSTEDDSPPVARADFSGPPVVLCVGRILDGPEGYKGHRELIDCWPAVTSAVGGARLVFAGGGQGLAALRAYAAASPAAPAIDVLGFVPEAQMAALYARAHVFAMPSRNEGFGIVYAEAMRYGVPVIASIHDAGGEVNVHGVTGYNVDMDRPDDLPGRIVGLLSDRETLLRFSDAGYKRWDGHFRYSSFARRLRESLADVPAFQRLSRPAA